MCSRSSKSSLAVLRLPPYAALPSKQGDLLENIFHKLPPHRLYFVSNDMQGTYAIPASVDGGIPAPTASPLPKSPGGGGGGGGEEAHSPPGPDVDDEESMDWWTKYFASVDAMIEASTTLLRLRTKYKALQIYLSKRLGEPYLMACSHQAIGASLM